MAVLFSCPYFPLFADSPTPGLSTLSLHDALPIWRRRAPSRPASVFLDLERGTVGRQRHRSGVVRGDECADVDPLDRRIEVREQDRKSTRLNSSHLVISYAVFCLKKKNKKLHTITS